MKLHTLVATIIFTTSLFGFDYKLNEKKVTDNVYCFFGEANMPNHENGGAICNICFVDEGEYYTTIDSGPSYKFAKQAYKHISDKYGKKPVKYVLITHAHDDHHLGNEFYSKNEATIIGSKHLEEQLGDNRMKKMISKEAYEGTNLYMPDVRIKDGDKYGNIKAIILEPQAHSTSDIVYLDEKNKVVFTGDLAFNGRVLSIRDGSLKGWLSSLQKLEKLDFDYMITGHGEDTSNTAHLITREYLMLLKEKVGEAVDEDIGLDEATSSIDIEKFKSYPLYDQVHKRNVSTIYQELEFE
jgi:cyclase